MEKNKASNANTQKLSVKRLGVIVNPVAGMGGPVGLKGTDGAEILERALALGAKPVAPLKAKAFFSELSAVKSGLDLLVGAGDMGESEARACGFECTVLGKPKVSTVPEDTCEVAQRMLKEGVDFLVFCGGDGTARNVLSVVGLQVPVLGVPTGVKMHSAVFALTPVAAARVVARFLWRGLPLHEAEVMDVDEAVFREGRVSAHLYGYVLAPYEPHLIQTNKLASPMTESELENQAALALYIIENMQPNTLYIICPGTTTRTIADLLDQKKTLLGVDLFVNKKIVAKDVTETQLLDALRGAEAVQVVVTPIGGQGFVFGRGNQQISPRVLRGVGLDNVVVVATESKLRGLKSLKVDTGDAALDAELRARKMRVISDYGVVRQLHVE
ncbi:MAG: ATP-NAD kinase family protein [Candidatus Bathyarchaeota archaeon]|nr:ATP-NAD kinase family protein [Candidatus Bathyarchaeota archaeon]